MNIQLIEEKMTDHFLVDLKNKNGWLVGNAVHNNFYVLLDS